MIWVFLDHSSIGTGTTEFADSVNNGPWGHALTTELIPTLEKQYRMDAKPQGRFLTGHSSGGWATLVAAGALSEDLRRHLVDLTRSQRLPRLHRRGPLLPRTPISTPIRPASRAR